MVEAARRHGPFDVRYTASRRAAAPVRELREDRAGAERVEWSVFLARSFPKRRRHDLGALTAFAAYGSTLGEARSSSLGVWEWEGGGAGRVPD